MLVGMSGELLITAATVVVLILDRNRLNIVSQLSTLLRGVSPQHFSGANTAMGEVYIGLP